MPSVQILFADKQLDGTKDPNSPRAANEIDIVLAGFPPNAALEYEISEGDLSFKGDISADGNGKFTRWFKMTNPSVRAAIANFGAASWNDTLSGSPGNAVEWQITSDNAAVTLRLV